MSFTHYHCANGFAKPVNPFDYDSTVEYTAYERFAIFAKENTISCSEDLSGEYEKDLFKEPQLQILSTVRHFPGTEWVSLNKLVTHEITLEMLMEDCNKNGYETRQYIELKAVEKEPKLTNVNDCPDWANDKCSCGYLKDCKLNNPVKQPEVKQEFWDKKVHELKTWQPYFDNVKEGKKKFEVRKNDRDYQVGDLVVLKEYNPCNNTFTGRSIQKEIIYILHGGEFGIEAGYCVLQML